MKLLIISLSMIFFEQAYAQAEEKIVDDSESENKSSKMNRNLGYASYEYFSPDERLDYSMNGVNIGIQRNYKFKDTLTTMIMSPNLSLFSKNKGGIEEDLVFAKWDHGLAYDVEMANNLIMQPSVMIGVGYGWLNSTRPFGGSQNDENAPMYEALAGLNFKTAQDMNIFAKGGYRLFDVDDVGSENTGELNGALAMVGLGMGF
jgi:hypothetical protein